MRQWIGAERAFRDDTLRYSLCGFDLSPLENMLVYVNRCLKRSKAFDDGRIQGRIVAALDGIGRRHRRLCACSPDCPISYGSRFFDIHLLDALYAQTPVLKL